MKIKIVSVEVTQAPAKGKGKPYSNAQIVYMNERGEPKKWNLVSFSNPQVFETLKDANQGDVYEITTTKNGEYTNWAAATKFDASAVPDKPTPQKTETGGAKTFQSTYETPEERALKQRLIVRQSSLAQAIAVRDPEDGIDDILELAEQFAAWVYKQPSLIEMDNDTDEFEDIPL